jgi:hypothetical protein
MSISLLALPLSRSSFYVSDVVACLQDCVGVCSCISVLRYNDSIKWLAISHAMRESLACSCINTTTMHYHGTTRLWVAIVYPFSFRGVGLYKGSSGHGPKKGRDFAYGVALVQRVRPTNRLRTKYPSYFMSIYA